MRFFSAVIFVCEQTEHFFYFTFFLEGYWYLMMYVYHVNSWKSAPWRKIALFYENIP